MAEYEKEQGITDRIKKGLGYLSQTISESIFSPITEGAEMVLNNIEDRIIKIEQRITMRISSFLMRLLGGLFLIFALFFFLSEFLRWSNAAASFSVGILIFVIGLLIKPVR